MGKHILNNYQFRTRPVGSDPKTPDYTPDMWVTDIIEKGPIRNRSFPQGGRRVGYLEWEKSDGGPTSEVHMVEIDPEHRRKGLATAAFDHSQEIAISSGFRIPIPVHSSFRTDEEDAWVKSVSKNAKPRIQ